MPSSDVSMEDAIGSDGEESDNAHISEDESEYDSSSMSTTSKDSASNPDNRMDMDNPKVVCSDLTENNYAKIYSVLRNINGGW